MQLQLTRWRTGLRAQMTCQPLRLVSNLRKVQFSQALALALQPVAHGGLDLLMIVCGRLHQQDKPRGSSHFVVTGTDTVTQLLAGTQLVKKGCADMLVQQLPAGTLVQAA